MVQRAFSPTPSGANASGYYRPDIDGLRAFGGVLLFHLFPKQLPGGFTGVDVSLFQDF
jgi:peptidoglycan/LPS O-acetylase OafA/YrhL